MNITQWYDHINDTLQSENPHAHDILLHAVERCAHRTKFDLHEELLLKSAEYGRVELIGKIFKFFPVLYQNIVVSYAISEAARKGQSKAIEALLPHRCPEYTCNIALEEAAARGHVECVTTLIPFSDCMGYNSQAFRHAAQKNRLECVKALLPCSDPCARNSEALQYACAHRNTEMIELLYPLHSLEQIKSAVEDMNSSVGQEFTQDDADFLQQMYTRSLLQSAIKGHKSSVVKTPHKI
jgi:hypothetical protein